MMSAPRDRAAYEKFGEGGDCLAQSRRGRRDGRAAYPHAAESGRAALVAAVAMPFDLPDWRAWTRLVIYPMSLYPMMDR